jgi:hypothetical protein
MGGNVDPDKFMHLLDDVQVLILEPVLGTKLYDKILTDFDDDTLAGDYLKILNDYVKPCLWHSVFAQYLRDGVVLAQNTGIFTNSPENATPSNLDDIQYVSKSAQSKSDVYIERLERYLCDVNVPEYENPQDNDYDIKPQRDISTIGGWYLGDWKKYDWKIDETKEDV